MQQAGAPGQQSGSDASPLPNATPSITSTITGHSPPPVPAAPGAEFLLHFVGAGTIKGSSRLSGDRVRLLPFHYLI